MRLYSLLEGSQDIDQFLNSIHRYVQIGIHVKGYMSAELQRFQREIVEVCEFYVDQDNVARSNVIFQKNLDGTYAFNEPSKGLHDYFSSQGKVLRENIFMNEGGTNGGTTAESQSTLAAFETPSEVPSDVAQEGGAVPDPQVAPVAPAPDVNVAPQVAPAAMPGQVINNNGQVESL